MGNGIGKAELPRYKLQRMAEIIISLLPHLRIPHIIHDWQAYAVHVHAELMCFAGKRVQRIGTEAAADRFSRLACTKRYKRACIDSTRDFICLQGPAVFNDTRAA